jgi:hypothetical protein
MTMGKAEDPRATLDVEMIEHPEDPNDITKSCPEAYESQGLTTTYKTKAERAVLLKADLCIVPLAALCYLVSYLVSSPRFKSSGRHTDVCGMQDRNNIGYARLMGWQKDIHLSNADYYNISSLFCKFTKSPRTC